MSFTCEFCWSKQDSIIIVYNTRKIKFMIGPCQALRPSLTVCKQCNEKKMNLTKNYKQTCFVQSLIILERAMSAIYTTEKIIHFDINVGPPNTNILAACRYGLLCTGHFRLFTRSAIQGNAFVLRTATKNKIKFFIVL